MQISGVRAYDPTLGTWTSPDAYEGDMHDPASQQRYMWNHNNPYEYSDPTGFYPGQIGDASNQPYSWDDPTQIAARPRNEDSRPGKKGGSKKTPRHDYMNDLRHQLHLDETLPKAPAGSRTIDKTPFTRWHDQVKGNVGAGAKDSVKIDTKDNVWVENYDGTWSNHGPVRQYYQPDKK